MFNYLHVIMILLIMFSTAVSGHDHSNSFQQAERIATLVNSAEAASDSNERKNYCNSLDNYVTEHLHGAALINFLSDEFILELMINKAPCSKISIYPLIKKLGFIDGCLDNCDFPQKNDDDFIGSISEIIKDYKNNGKPIIKSCGVKYYDGTLMNSCTKCFTNKDWVGFFKNDDNNSNNDNSESKQNYFHCVCSKIDNNLEVIGNNKLLDTVLNENFKDKCNNFCETCHPYEKITGLMDSINNLYDSLAKLYEPYSNTSSYVFGYYKNNDSSMSNFKDTFFNNFNEFKNEKIFKDSNRLPMFLMIKNKLNDIVDTNTTLKSFMEINFEESDSILREFANRLDSAIFVKVFYDSLLINVLEYETFDSLIAVQLEKLDKWIALDELDRNRNKLKSNINSYKTKLEKISNVKECLSKLHELHKMLSQVHKVDSEESKKIIIEFLNNLEHLEYATVQRAPRQTSKAALNATSVVDGTARFLVERVRDELALVFMENLREFLVNDPDSIGLKEYFPSVWKVMRHHNVNSFTSWGRQFQSAVQTDLSQIHSRLHEVLDPVIIYLREKYPDDVLMQESLATLRIALKLVHYQGRGNHPINMVHLLTDNYGYSKNPDTLFANKVLSVLAFLVSSVEYLDSDKKIVMVEPNEIVLLNLPKNELQKEIFIRLIAAQNKPVLESIMASEEVFMPGMSIYDVLTITDTRDASQRKGRDMLIFSFLQTLASLSYVNNEIINPVFYDENNDNRNIPVSVNHAMSEMFKEGEAIVRDYIDTGDYQDFSEIMANATRFTNGLLEQNYSMAVMSLNIIAMDYLDYLIESTKGAIDYTNTAVNNDSLIHSIIRLNKVKQNLIFWGGFLADLADAKGTITVKEFLDKYADETGSYRLKRNSFHTLTLNAYPGLNPVNMEYERYTAPFSSSGELLAISSNITAPIGISYNWHPLSLKEENSDNRNVIVKRSSRFRNDNGKRFQRNSFSPSNSLKYGEFKNRIWGLFLPVIDIGAPFVFRWTNSDDPFHDKINWGDVFAPGLYLTLAHRNNGLSFMAGTQLSPKLVKYDGNELVRDDQTWRFGFSLTYDIPIVTFYRQTSYTSGNDRKIRVILN